MKTDYNKLILLQKDKKNRTIPAKKDINIISNMYPFSKDYMSYLETLNTYEVASIMVDNNSWQKSRSGNPITYSYTCGEIVMVNMGASNYGYELSYKHPGIIWEDLTSAVLIIPCTSTQKKPNPFIVTGEQKDGFKNQTTIMLDKIRVIDKKRINGNKNGGVLGKITKLKIDEIRDKLLNIYFSGTIKFINKLQTSITDKDSQIKTLNEEINNLKEEINKLKSEK